MVIFTITNWAIDTKPEESVAIKAAEIEKKRRTEDKSRRWGETRIKFQADL